MFARKISIHLKPNTLAEFTKTFEQNVVPLLRKQHGFKDEITFLAGSSEVTTISLWDTKQNAEAHGGNGYKEVLKMLGNVIEGTPKVATREVIHSTFYDVPTVAPVAAAVAAPVAVA